MRATSFAVLGVCCSALFCVSCSKEDVAPVSTATTAAVVETAKRVSACDMVTQAEMSAILGGAVVAAAGGNESPPSSTECIYSTPGAADPFAEPQGYVADTSSAPYAELQVDWGGGDVQTLDQTTGLAESAAPIGAVDSLQGLGDRAYQITADQVFISTRGDLMMIRFPPRSSDVIAKARKIFETAKARI